MIETTFFSTYFLPGVLALIMFGMGSTLSTADFRQILSNPVGVLVGLFCQMILLPGMAYLIAIYSGLSAEYQVGLMLIAACPGGAVSNLLSFLMRGNLALSVAFTSINSFLTIFSIPIIVNFSVSHFMGGQAEIAMPFWETVLQILLITIVPVVLGMIFKARQPAAAQRLQSISNLAMPVMLAVAMMAAIFLEKKEGQGVPASELLVVLPFALLLNVLGMFAGWAVAGLLRLGKASQITVGFEVGLQNSGLAIAVATSAFMLNNALMAVPASVYAMFSFFTAVAFGAIANGKDMNWREIWEGMKLTERIRSLGKATKQLPNTFPEFCRNNWKWLIFFMFPVFSLISHSFLFDNELLGIHAWRQCETASNVANFADGDMNIFNPQVYSLEWENGLKRMEFPIMQWLFAWVWRFFGQEVWMLRLMSWIVGYLGVLAMFKMGRHLFKDLFLALMLAWCWMHSPEIFYYFINPLPDNFSLTAALWGIAFFLEGYRKETWWSFFWAQLFFAIATASKLPFLLFFGLPWAFELSRLIRSKGRSLISGLSRVLPGMALLVAPMAWYLWVIPTWQGNGVVAGILDIKAEEVPQLVGILGRNVFSILPELLLNYASLGFFLLGIWMLFRGKLFKSKLAFPFGMLALGCFAYFAFEINMITDIHDYYLFPFIPGIFILVGIGLQAWWKSSHQALLWLSLAIFMALPITALLRAAPRYGSMSMAGGFRQCYESLSLVLPKDAKVISIGDDSPHVTLFHFRRFGWTVQEENYNEAKMVAWYQMGASHFVIRDHQLENIPLVKEHLDKAIFSCEEYVVWTIK